jgi:hypothetical protein
VNARKARHGYCPKDELLFKGRFPCSCPEASRASLPQCTRRHPAYGMGARPCMTRSCLAGAKKANRRARSVLPPRGSCVASSSSRSTVQPQARGPGLHVRHLACRFLRAEKTDCRGRGMPPPVVTRLPASTKSNDPVSHAGARTHESSTAGDSPWVQRSQTTARTNVAPPRDSRRRRGG